MADCVHVAGCQDRDSPVFGPSLGADKVPMAEIACALEDLPMPAELKNRFPDLSEADWDAYTRFCTLILSALTRRGSDI